MNRYKVGQLGLAVLLAVLVGPWDLTWAQKPAAVEPSEQTATPAFSAKGADTCLKCHDEESKFPVISIFRTRHARPADAHSPFAGRQCEACHGPGDVHARGADDDPVPPMRSFGIGKATPISKQNNTCLSCHAGGHRVSWPGSEHERADQPCVACHQIHAPSDPVLSATSQAEVCFGCHRSQRADSLKPSSHPVRQGKLACSDCHSVHGAMGEKLLTSPTLNETCYRCHAEKRGPFLWEHEPAAEDCALCHTAHGSHNPALLVQRVPLLCQSCHEPAGHPSVAYSSGGLAGGTANGFLLGSSCMNCHSQVHGSNHPSGATLTR